jgi:lipoic acid synthetase
LIPDFSAKEDSIRILCDEAPEVVSHNIETVRRLSADIRSKAQHDRSLKVLRMFREMNPHLFVKSSFMVGLGETDDEIYELMAELRSVDCQILTIGQYLSPTRLKRHVRVDRYVTPEQFQEYARRGKDMGFKHVMSAPLVRSSYIAEKGYNETAQSGIGCQL